MAIKKNPAYFVDNISSFLVSNIIKAKDGTFTYESLEDDWDDSILTASFEYDEKDAVRSMGAGKIIDVIQQHPTSGEGTVTFAKHAGGEFYNKILGWTKTAKNQYLGLGGVKCTPAVTAQFIAETRPESCDNVSERKRVLIIWYNTRFKEPNLEFEATNEDGPGENTQEVAFTALASKDEKVGGHGIMIMFEDQDMSSPTYNGDVFDKAIAGEVVLPAIPAITLGQTTSTGVAFNITNPLPDTADRTKTTVIILDEAGTETVVETAITKAVNGDTVGTFQATSLTASKNYQIYLNVGSKANPVKGERLVNFSTPATRRK